MSSNNIYKFFISFLMFFYLFMVYSFADIISAHEKSLKLNPDEAVKILEENDVKKVINNPATNINISIINDYAFFLSQIPSRYEESIPLLENIINKKPDRIVAYINIGDVYLKKYLFTGDITCIPKITTAYQKYTEFTKNKKINIPNRVIKFLNGFSDFGEFELQSVIATIEEDKLTDFFNPEKKLESNKCPKNFNKTIFDELSSSEYDVCFSFIDIDNDGVEELKVFYSAGTAYCKRYIFYKMDTNGLYSIKIKELSFLDQEGSWCYGDYVGFIKYKTKNYILLYENENIEVDILDKLELKKAAKLFKVYDLENFNVTSGYEQENFTEKPFKSKIGKELKFYLKSIIHNEDNYEQKIPGYFGKLEINYEKYRLTKHPLIFKAIKNDKNYSQIMENIAKKYTLKYPNPRFGSEIVCFIDHEKKKENVIYASEKDDVFLVNLESNSYFVLVERRSKASIGIKVYLLLDNGNGNLNLIENIRLNFNKLIKY